jgi:lysophospholipase L1-like esterase
VRPAAARPAREVGSVVDERRVLSVRRGAIVLAVALVLGLVLGAGPLWTAAKNLSSPVPRAVAIGITAPFAGLNHLLHLEGARRTIVAAFGGAEAQAGSGDELAEQDPPTGPPPGPPPGSPTEGMLPGAAPLGSGAAAVSHPGTIHTTTTAHRRAVFDAKHPLHILVVGDSLVGKLVDSLMRASGRLPIKVDFRFKVSSGLVNTGFFNWPAEMRRLVARYDPDVTVMMFGNNDHLRLPVGGRLLSPFSSEWQSEYRKKVEAITAIAGKGGSHVVWIGMPIMRTEKLDGTARALNPIFAAVCKAHGYWYVDTYKMFSTSDGKYAPYLKEPSGKTLIMRAADGVHLTPAGGDRLARQVQRVLEQHFTLKKQTSS